MSIGLWMRWSLAGYGSLSVEFAHLRHAHSHLGYFGLLFPLAWLAWNALGIEVPGRRALLLYAAATTLAFGGFLRAGYKVDAIIGCTVVAGVWLYSVWPIRRRLLQWNDPLAVTLPGVVLGLACIPPIALTLRSSPAIAHGFVATFLAMLLLGVVVPTAIAAEGRTLGPWPVVLLAAALSAAALGVWPTLIPHLGLLGYAGLLGWVAAKSSLPLHLRAAWGAVGSGLLLIAVGALPNSRPVALGATHFLILGPVLASLVPRSLRYPPSSLAWMLSHAFAGIMAGALTAQGLGAGPWTATAAAIGGTLTVSFWTILLIRQALPSPS